VWPTFVPCDAPVGRRPWSAETARSGSWRARNNPPTKNDMHWLVLIRQAEGAAGICAG
jgi:hypothetical protein